MAKEYSNLFFFILKIICCNVVIEKATLRAVHPFPSVQGHLKTWPGCGMRSQSAFDGDLWHDQTFADTAEPSLTSLSHEWLYTGKAGYLLWRQWPFWTVQWLLCLGSGRDLTSGEPRDRSARWRRRRAACGSCWDSVAMNLCCSDLSGFWQIRMQLCYAEVIC